MICLFLTLCHFVLVFISPFSIAITSLGEERASLSVFRTFVRFVLVWICRFPLPLGVRRFVIVTLPGPFSYPFFFFFFFFFFCLAVNPIMVDRFAYFFNCTRVGRGSGSVVAPT